MLYKFELLNRPNFRTKNVLIIAYFTNLFERKSFDAICNKVSNVFLGLKELICEVFFRIAHIFSAGFNSGLYGGKTPGKYFQEFLVTLLYEKLHCPEP